MENSELKNEAVMKENATDSTATKSKKRKKSKEKKSIIHGEVVKNLSKETKSLQSLATALFDKCALDTTTLLGIAASKLESADGVNLISRKDAAEMLKKISSLKLQPEKGSSKDIRSVVKITKLINKMIITPEQMK